MANFKKPFIVLIVLVFMGALVFAGGPSRRELFPGEAGEAPYAQGQVLVKFKNGITANAANQIAAQNGMTVKKRFATLSKLKGFEYALLQSTIADTPGMMSILANNASVAAVAPNIRNKLDATPNDPIYAAYLWGLNNTGQTGGTADADIDAPEAWDISTGSTNTIVAVIDTGLDYLHPDLAANAWVNTAEQAGIPGIDDDGNGYVDDIYGIDPAGVDGLTPDTDPMDVYGHGTHCAGTIGAVGNNSQGVVGVNWNVQIMGLKFFDDTGSNGYNSFAIECIEYILFQKLYRGKNIVAVNASWGSYNYFDTMLYDAIAALGDAGIIFSTSAGNDANDNDDIYIHYPSSYDLPNIITAAATDHDDLITDFSNFGLTSVDLGAPGASIASTVPGVYTPQAGDIFFDNMEGGAGNWVTSGTNNSWAITTEYETFWGGSYPAAPSPTHFWSDSPGAGGAYGFYLANTESYLTYDADIDLSGYVGQETYFGMSIGRHIANYDHLYLEFSKDSGASWETFYDWGPTGGYVYYWASNAWLIPDAYKTAHFRMRFHFYSDASANGLGVVIDDVGIGTTLTYSYALWSGTSMATPHVTGAAALLAAQFPSESVATRVARILDNVDPLTSLDGLCVTGGRLNLFNAISAAAAETTITVSSPNGGEEWTAGSLLNITWNSTGAIAHVNIDYSIDSGTSWTSLAAGTDNDGSYTWTVPATPSTTCLVRISDSADNVPSDSSDAEFTILTAGTETVSAPETPLGPSIGIAGSSYDFSTKGSESSMGVGHPLQYKFDWDDGSDSGWLNAGTISTQASHAWAKSGTYQVRAMARCANHTDIESLWSPSHAIIITDSGSAGYLNSPASRLVLPEVIWASASGGGTWMSEVQITDISGGSQVSVCFSTASGRQGPFLLWNNSSGGALSSMKFSNILQIIDGLDTSAFIYFGTVGAVEFVTQDGSHLLQAAARTLNGNYSKTSRALSLHDSNTADTSRAMIIPNLTSDAKYRSSCGFYNTTADAMTIKLKLMDETNSQLGNTISKTLDGYGFISFNPFSEAVVPPGTFNNVILLVQPDQGAGKAVCFGASANNLTNDPAAHVAVQSGSSYDNGPSSLQIVPEVVWAAASGGGTWVTEVQIVDMTGGSQVTVYFDYGGGLRRGPFVLWNGGAAGTKTKCSNLLEAIDNLDSEAFTYYGKGGTVEFQTQDGSHAIQVTARTLNGDYSKTFPGLNLVNAETADTSRVMLVQNLTNNASYRSNCGFFNPTGDEVTVEFTLLDKDGDEIGTQFSKTFAGYDFQSFSPFTEAGVPYPGTACDNVILRVRPTTGTGSVMCFGASANNASNDPASHLAVQAE